MFPKKFKKHKMNTRFSEEFKVEFANTKRMKKSPIIYMQNLLNENNN